MAKAKKEELTPEELQAKCEALEIENTELQAKNEASEDLIVEMTEQLELLSKAKTIKNPVVIIDKAKYEVVIPRFNHNGRICTAEDVVADKELAKELAEQGSGVLILKD